MNDFLILCSSEPWIAAHTVYEKNKRKLNLELEDLVTIRNHLNNLAPERKANNLKVNEGILIQEGGKFVKELIINRDGQEY
jgi:hypothetical protein